jgi:toxin YhaV
MQIGDWQVYAHPLFLDQLDALITAVDRTRLKDPTGYMNGRDAKMLAAVVKLAFEDIPADPSHKRFEQGETLGAGRKHWRRAKFYQQYRLFFRFSTAAKVIVLAWVNDEQTKRAYGGRTDAYATFAKMLTSGHPPDDSDALVKAAQAPSASARLTAIQPLE